MRLNEPLPPSPVTYPKCSGSGGNSTCLRVLFLTRSPKPAVRQVRLRLGGRCSVWLHAGAAADKRRPLELAGSAF